jgi:hypothetical protein
MDPCKFLGTVINQYFQVTKKKIFIEFLKPRNALKRKALGFL